MTTVTPSDQADRTSSAKRTATVPTQRSGRALRLLVLGTGDGAAAFRDRAALAGAQLAQRFSVRVTHVVVEDGIGEQDARVVRARTAGIPVLGLADGTRLLETETQAEAFGGVADAVSASAPASASASVSAPTMRRDKPHGEGDSAAVGNEEAGRGPDGTQGETAERGRAGTRGEGAEGGSDGTRTEGSGSGRGSGLDPERGVSGDELLGESEPRAESDDDQSADAEALLRSSVLSLIPHRTEFVPDPSDVRPTDVFAEAALEAVLSVPPLRSEGDVEAKADVDQVVPAEDTSTGGQVPLGEASLPGEAGVDSVTAAALADAAADGDADADADDAGHGSAADREVIESVSEREAVASNAADAPAEAVAGCGRRGARTVASVAWALLPMVSVGLLTPVGIGYAAYRLRSRPIIAATACYTFAVGVAFAVSAAAPMRTGTHAASGALLAACVGVSWLGGTAHSFLIRRRVFQ